MKQSAGIVVYRKRKQTLEVFLVHPGGPFWAKKDEGAWSIPKGEFSIQEDSLEAAKREFKEETGYELTGTFISLGEIRQSKVKTVRVWAIEAEINSQAIKCNTFAMEWPPHSGILQQFPEVDRGDWFDLLSARKKLNKGQVVIIDMLIKAVSSNENSRNQ